MSLSQFRWPSLARDFAIMMVPGSPLQDISQICQTYNISEKELAEILQIPYVQELVKRELAEFRSQGSRAANKYRAEALSQSLAEKLFRDATNDKMEPKDAIKLLELYFKSAGVFDSKETAVNVNVAAGVQISNLPPIPKLKHLTATPMVPSV